jgi:hypothetical protein
VVQLGLKGIKTTMNMGIKGIKTGTKMANATTSVMQNSVKGSKLASATFKAASSVAPIKINGPSLASLNQFKNLTNRAEGALFGSDEQAKETAAYTVTRFVRFAAAKKQEKPWPHGHLEKRDTALKGLVIAKAGANVVDAAKQLSDAMALTSGKIANSTAMRVAKILLPLMGFLALGGILGYIEGWSVIDTIYFSAITVTGVGYGDVAPLSQEGRVFAIFYVPIGLVILLNAIGQVASAVQLAAMKNNNVTPETYLTMDKDGDGSIDKNEVSI